MMKSISVNFSIILASLIVLAPLCRQDCNAQTGGDDVVSKSSDGPINAQPDDKKDESSTKTDNNKRPYSEKAVKHYNRAVELHQSGYLNPAIAEYNAAIQADDRLEEAYSNLGVIYAAQRSYAKAIEAFNKALLLKPSRPTTLNGLGSVLYAKGKIEAAKEKWRQAIAADPGFASAYYNIGNACEAEKDQASAIKSYAKAIEVNPSMADAYFRIGSICNKEKHTAQAKLLLSKAVELSPDADFVREARKQLSQIESELNEESNIEEVKMNVMVPSDAQDSRSTTTSSKRSSIRQDAPATVEDSRMTDSNPDARQHDTESDTSVQPVPKRKFLLFKPKSKPEKKIDMFIQPKDSSEKSKVEDLKPSSSP